MNAKVPRGMPPQWRVSRIGRARMRPWVVTYNSVGNIKAFATWRAAYDYARHGADAIRQAVEALQSQARGLLTADQVVSALGMPCIRNVAPPYQGVRLMKCSDLPDAMFLEAVRRAAPVGWHTASWWDTQGELAADVGYVPGNLVRAKARKLIDRGLIDGCACGCRGNFVVLEGSV